MPIMKLKDVLYRNDIYFIHGESDEKIKAYLKRKADYDAAEIVKKSSGFFVSFGEPTCEFYIVITKQADNWIGTLVHECLHATSAVLRDRGIELTAETEEAYAYYLQWLFNSLHCLLQKRGQKGENENK